MKIFNLLLIHDKLQYILKNLEISMKNFNEFINYNYYRSVSLQHYLFVPLSFSKMHVEAFN